MVKKCTSFFRCCLFCFIYSSLSYREKRVQVQRYSQEKQDLRLIEPKVCRRIVRDFFDSNGNYISGYCPFVGFFDARECIKLDLLFPHKKLDFNMQLKSIHDNSKLDRAAWVSNNSLHSLSCPCLKVISYPNFAVHLHALRCLFSAFSPHESVSMSSMSLAFIPVSSMCLVYSDVNILVSSQHLPHHSRKNQESSVVLIL